MRPDASSMCVSRYGMEGLKRTAVQLATCALPSTIVKPAGVCIHELRARIQKAESVVPIATRMVDSVWTRFVTRLAPNSMMPRKVASRKKAVSTS